MFHPICTSTEFTEIWIFWVGKTTERYHPERLRVWVALAWLDYDGGGWMALTLCAVMLSSPLLNQTLIPHPHRSSC